MLSEQVQKLVFDYTREVTRKTMPNYYKAVMPGRSTRPYWSCTHKHENRSLAFLCVMNQYPKLFGGPERRIEILRKLE